MSGLIARGKTNKIDTVKEAYEWADTLLDEEDQLFKFINNIKLVIIL